MLYYNWLAVYLKTTKFQLLTRRYFPLLALALFTLMTVMVLQPTLNIKSSRAEQWCQYVHTDIQSRSGKQWSNLIGPDLSRFCPLIGRILLC